MSQSSPGLSGFMNNVMGSNSGSGPPPPMATQGPNAIPTPLSRPGNNNFANRPDLNMSRSNFVDDGINIRENTQKMPVFEKSSRNRPEMKGPSDISDILSGLKTKTINIQEAPHDPTTTDNSTISISDLKSLQSSSNMPKKSRKRTKSASNTVSLDI
jgi:hypothetical protein